MLLKELNTLEGEELKIFLRSKKAELIEEKKSSLKIADTLTASPIIKANESLKKSSDDLEDGSFLVKVVANATNFLDSHMDVIIPGAYSKSIAARGTSIPHIADHKHESTAHVGDVEKVYTENLSVKDLGYATDGKIEVLIFETRIREDYNEDVYKFYKAGKINQHSIGLTYTELKLALNSSVEEDKTEKEIWDKYYPSIINKELVDKKGYFWAVEEIDVRENSAVLFGANSLTPTLSISKNAFTQQPHITKTTNKGVTMTIEELQAEVIRLSAENSQLKGSQDLAVKSAVKAEQERILGIQKAAETFGIKNDISKFIKMNTDVDSCVAMFEVIKENTQIANGSPKADGVEASLSDKTVADISAKPTGLEETLKGFEALAKATNMFEGVK